MAHSGDSSHEWWRGSVIYQIYPRSFQDTNGDGIGDLQGIIERLDYIASLGAAGIWISPFFKSPMDDFGYDVADYKAVDPMFGANEDFDRLVNEAHQRGLKVLIDLVLSHTSDQHEWFIESRKNKTNPKADWYVWADANEDGTPPNNWLAHFGGSSWEWCAERGQYYFHNFLISQPDLNLHAPALQEALLDVVKFWLEKGVDGFRLDVADYYFHDPELRPNPPQLDKSKIKRLEPYFMQRHIYDRDRPELIPFLKKLRALTNGYENIMMVAEISEAGGIEASARYTAGDDLLHTSYNFSLLSQDFSPAHVRASVESYFAQAPDGWPSWAFSNHDAVRVATRWGGDNPSDEFIEMVNALLLCLPGTLYVYQGQELGFIDSDVPFEKMQDPYGIAQYPRGRGRDGCRTPMVWEQSMPHGGFTTAAEPWLPVEARHLPFAVDQNTRILQSFCAMLARRNNTPALRYGGIRFTQSDAEKLTFVREWQGHAVTCHFDFKAGRYQLDEADVAISSENQILAK